MKREALKHPKMQHFASLLDISRVEAIGYLTLLTDFVRDIAPQGNVGKFPNGAISRSCDWMGDPDEFVDALVTAGWMDEDASHRLLMHDWEDHCENWVKAKLKKQGLMIFRTPPKSGGNSSAVATAEATAEPTAEATAVRSPPCDPAQPSPAHTQPSPVESQQAATRQNGEPKSEYSFRMQNGTWDMPQSKLDEYLASYGSRVDVHAELVKARQYLIDNKPRRSRSVQGIKKQLTAWLNRSVDNTPRGSPSAGGRASVREEICNMEF